MITLIFRQLLDQVAQLQKQSNKMKIELEERRDESDRFKVDNPPFKIMVDRNLNRDSKGKRNPEKCLFLTLTLQALQNHSSHQQVILNQLRSRLEDHE